jgi:hypothetical protein
VECDALGVEQLQVEVLVHAGRGVNDELHGVAHLSVVGAALAVLVEFKFVALLHAWLVPVQPVHGQVHADDQRQGHGVDPPARRHEEQRQVRNGYQGDHQAEGNQTAQGHSHGCQGSTEAMLLIAGGSRIERKLVENQDAVCLGT